ncbi:mandelate racemase/muconate lactonizing enzyme family protein [Labrys okinawensis]|uniref:mandelate racemase/muconate lactonizing enzyme family protein n=1 Tax=Labrys okinawensis TaxID=346911 RepID=UPI0039BCAF07
MKIKAIDVLQADAGWRLFSFVKITTDSDIVGWSEYNESFGSRGLAEVIRALAPLVIGLDPMRSEFIWAHLNTNSRQSRGGLNHQAIAAIENALLDIRGKALGVPICALFGGPVRERVPVYWSHFATYRVYTPQYLSGPEPKNYDDLAKQAAEVKAAGFKALKTNILPFDGQKLQPFNPGFGRTSGHPELNWDNRLLLGVADQLGAIREAVGPEMGLMLDINFHFKTEGFRRVADTVAPFKLTWLEMDTHDAPSLALIRRGAPCPIAACETLVGRRDFKAYFENYAMDTAIIDVVWNGLGESVKIATMAEVYEMNVAPHNFYGHLSTIMSAHFAALVPNLRIMEIDMDSVAWRDEFYTDTPKIENSELIVPTGPGWGLEVNEKAVRARPPKG